MRHVIAYDAKPGTTVRNAFRHCDPFPSDSTIRRWRASGFVERRGQLDVITRDGYLYFPQLSYMDGVPVRR